jgi:hypothetical protein
MPTIDADAALALEHTTLERIEFLLATLACSMTGQSPQALLPWRRAGIQAFMQEVARGK